MTGEVATRTEPVRLPNGLVAELDDAKSAAVLYAQVLDYFRHGIEVRQGMTVIDAGANVGLFALEVLQRCSSDCRALCFEPAPPTYAILRRNLAACFPHAPVRTFANALGARAGEATLYYSSRSSAQATLSREEAYSQRDIECWTRLVRDRALPREFRAHIPRWIRHVPRALVRRGVAREVARRIASLVEVPCRVVSLSEVLHSEAVPRVDLLKVDVEGCELDVLRGIAAEHWGRIEAVVVEVRDVSRHLAQIAELLTANGLQVVGTHQDIVMRELKLTCVYARRGGRDVGH